MSGVKTVGSEPTVPEWCIDRAKEIADLHGSEFWLPYLEVVYRENLALYGDPFPEEDPAVVAERKRRDRVRDRQRVLAPERFVGGGGR